MLLSGYFRAMLTDYTAIWLLKWCEIEHCSLNSTGQTQKRFVKLWLSNCRWSIFHSLITESLVFVRQEVIAGTLTSSPNCKVTRLMQTVKAVSIWMFHSSRKTQLWWLLLVNFSSLLEKLSVDVVSLQSSAGRKQLAKPQEPSGLGSLKLKKMQTRVYHGKHSFWLVLDYLFFFSFFPGVPLVHV